MIACKVAPQQWVEVAGDSVYAKCARRWLKFAFLRRFKNLTQFHLPGDGLCNDALRRMTPQVIWSTAFSRAGASTSLDSAAK